MSTNPMSRDQEIGASIMAKLGLSHEAITYDEEGNLIVLRLSPWMSGNLEAQDSDKMLVYGSIQPILLPSEIWELTNLQRLDLSNNQLSQLPPEIWELTNLQELDFSNNQLSQLPSEIGQLTNLQVLFLNDNQLSQLPPEIGQLTELGGLDLRNNQLSQLPPEIGRLTDLLALFLSNNQLRSLPPEIGQLRDLIMLELDNNPQLLSPPPEIVARGKMDILAFLRELQEDSFVRYEAKLLVVGEGGTGKSSLLRMLKEEGFESDLPTTHGIEVGQLMLPHPYRSGTELTLNTWDFGGQHIYHATHQFFLTQRSVYLVVWNARLGADQGRLNYWLDTIKALAPDEPVLLVATHIDERAPDLNYQLYKDAYPQLAGSLSVSNMSREGLAELKDKLADVAAQLPVMGQPWPKKWLEAEKTLLARPEHHFDAATYSACCSAVEVDPEISRGTLGNYLHDLGKILYFRDDAVLSNLVVLKPNWVTKAISYVLEDEATRKAKGILRHADLPRIWATDEE